MTWLGTRRATAAAIVISLALAACSLRLGFITDDYAFRAKLAHDHAPAELFTFQTGDPTTNAALVRIGRLPWWAAPDLEIHFLRPLTGELFAAEAAIFDDAAVGYHAVALGLLALLYLGIAVLYRTVLPRPTATVALLVFGLAGAHTEAYAWLAANHALLGALAGVWALALYVRAPGRWRWLALVPLALGLAASETTLGVVPLWCGLAWSRPRLDGIAPVVVGVAYLAIYVALGAGTRGSGGYHDPLSDPVGFASLVGTRLPILLGDAALAIPSGLAMLGHVPVLALAGLLAVAFVGYAGRALPRPLLWFVLGGVLAVLPGVAGYPTGRVLLVPDIAFAAALGAILMARPVRVPAIAIVIAVAHLLVAPLFGLHELRALARRGDVSDRAAAEVAALVAPGSRAILIASADPYVFLYPRGVLAATHPGVVTCWSVLSAARSRHRLTRTGERTFTLELLDQPIAAGFDGLFRSADRPFHAGDRFEQCGAMIAVAALDPRGLPTRLDVAYQRDLADPKLAFLVERDHRLERFTFPEPGSSVELP